jgi:hypothetical protein
MRLSMRIKRKINKAESQVDVLRRVHELSDLIDYTIHHLNNDIKRGGPGNRPDTFGVYENWVTQRVSNIFRSRYPNIDFKRLDFLMIVSGAYNDKLKRGFKDSKKIK